MARRDGGETANSRNETSFESGRDVLFDSTGNDDETSTSVRAGELAGFRRLCVRCHPEHKLAPALLTFQGGNCKCDADLYSARPGVTRYVASRDVQHAKPVKCSLSAMPQLS